MMQKLQRRDFLKLAGGVTVSSFVVPDALMANSGDDLGDFKAMVVVDLNGGNDAINTYIPTDTTTGSTTGYEYYAKARATKVRIKDNDMMTDLRNQVNSSGMLELNGGTNNLYYESDNIYDNYVKGLYVLDKKGFDKKVAINGLMPEVAYWLDRGKGAVIQNVGSISAPATKDDLRNKVVKVPPFIFAHNQQQKLAQTGQAASINVPTGWLGRVADKWSGLPFGSGVYKMNINLSPYGRYRMFFGNSTNPMSYGGGGPVKWTRSFDPVLHLNLADNGSGDMFHNAYNKINKNIINQVAETVADWDGVSGDNNIFAGLKDSYGIEFYDASGNRVQKAPTDEHKIDRASDKSDTFLTAAKLIKIGKEKGFKRMVIAVSMGGFDQHATQGKTHSQRLRGLSLGIDRFMRSMEHLALIDNVTLFTVSEFGRSTGSNSDGTDHAWGGAHLVLGGSVQSGSYGRFPDLTLGGDEDYSNKGRLIPSTSFSQYYATMLKWFGADDDVLNYALPELKNFSTKDLGFMKQA